MANPTVGIDVVARLDSLRAELKTLGPGMEKEAKAMTAALAKEVKAATKATKDAAAATKNATTSTKAFGDAAGTAGSSAKKLRGALGAIGPEAVGVAGAVDDVGDVLEVASAAAEAMGIGVVGLSAGLAVATTATAAGYLAWRIYNDDAAKAAVIAADVMAAQVALGPILDSTRMATIDLAVATGELSEEQGDLERNAIRAHKALLAATDASRKQMAALRVEQGGVLTQMVDIGESIMPSWSPLGAVLRATTTSSEDLQDRINALDATVREANEATREDVAVTGEVIRAKAKAKSATSDLKDATKDAEQAERAYLAVQKARLAFVAEWIADQNEAVAATRRLVDQVAALDDTEVERIERAGEQRDAELVAQIERNRSLGEDYADLNAARVENERNTAAEIMAVEERVQRQKLGAYADTAGAIADIGSTLAESMSEKDKEAAMDAYRVSQAAALVQAGINAVLAVSEASASAPYPANIPSMIAAGAVGAAQVAAIAAAPPPSFADTPGPQRMEQGGLVRLAKDDLFVAAKDPGELRRQTGASDSGRRLSARADDRWMRDHLKTNGTLAKTIRGNERVGHGP